ncbi:uncharacterized protein LOC142827709 [Pelodiscus sinensis]|uniref:uncharacterized protein LOC142827709 n=1 Tax=Pelodiscus sinensis TaxID=13735 RepID=UPI003F6BC236
MTVHKMEVKCGHICPHGPGTGRTGTSGPDPGTGPGQGERPAAQLHAGQREWGQRSHCLPPQPPPAQYPGRQGGRDPGGHSGLSPGHPSGPANRCREGAGGQLVHQEEEEEDDRSQSPPAQHSSHHVSQVFSEIGEGSSVGPPASEGPSSPILPVLRSQGSLQRTQDRHHLLCRHVCAIECMERSLRNKICADEEWQERVWGQYIERCDRMYALLGTTAELMGPASQHSVARPPPVAPPSCPARPLFPPLTCPVLPPLCPLTCPCPILRPPNIGTSWCSLPRPGTRGRGAPEPTGVGEVSLHTHEALPVQGPLFPPPHSAPPSPYK